MAVGTRGSRAMVLSASTEPTVPSDAVTAAVIADISRVIGSFLLIPCATSRAHQSSFANPSSHRCFLLYRSFTFMTNSSRCFRKGYFLFCQDLVHFKPMFTLAKMRSMREWATTNEGGINSFVVHTTHTHRSGWGRLACGVANDDNSVPPSFLAEISQNSLSPGVVFIFGSSGSENSISMGMVCAVLCFQLWSAMEEATASQNEWVSEWGGGGG